MAVVTPRFLSGSTNGRGIVVQSATLGSGTVLHTSTSLVGANQFDEVYLNFVNLTTLAKRIVINAGGVVSGDRIRFTVPSSSGGLFRLLPGHRYNNGVIIRCVATGGAGNVAAHGYVNRSA